MSIHPYHGNRKLETCDGRVIDVPIQPATVYSFFDEDGRALYVGCSTDFLARLMAHRKKEWWTDVDTIKVEHFEAKRDAMAFERFRIGELLPLYNRAGIPPEVLAERDAEVAQTQEAAA